MKHYIYSININYLHVWIFFFQNSPELQETLNIKKCERVSRNHSKNIFNKDMQFSCQVRHEKPQSLFYKGSKKKPVLDL